MARPLLDQSSPTADGTPSRLHEERRQFVTNYRFSSGKLKALSSSAVSVSDRTYAGNGDRDRDGVRRNDLVAGLHARHRHAGYERRL